MRRASYDCWIDVPHKLVLIVDRNDDPLCPSVTNDAENVVADLVERKIEVDRWLIAYRDSTGRWDRLRTAQNLFVGFAPLSDAEQAAVAEGWRVVWDLQSIRPRAPR